MSQRDSYILIRRDRFRNFLVGLLNAKQADEVLAEVERSSEVVELSPGDRLMRQSDVVAALEGKR